MARGSVKADPKISELDRARMKEAGGWLQAARQSRGLSQQHLAKALGMKRHMRLSQYETGYARLPPDLYRPWAEAVGLDARDVALQLMRIYTPELFEILMKE